MLRLAIGAGTSIDHYLSTGARTAAEVAAALLDTDHAIESGGKMLDLGCGCGRVAQALHEISSKLELHGCDIDEKAVEWANRHLPYEFKRNDFTPPLPYDDASFDVVLAMSVFTHLDEALQDAWLLEINRVLRPGGLAALSVGGTTTFNRICQSGRSTNSRDCTARLRSHTALAPEQFISEPYVRNWANADGMRGTSTGYGMTFHGAQYVRDHWAKWFEIEAILPDAVNEGQDLVLGRPR